MKVTILDVENTVTTKDGKKHFDPFERTNALVMVGIFPLDAEDSSTYIFDHSSVTGKDDIVSNYYAVQGALDETDLLVGHNISHDLIWLWESGFKYNGQVYDTMLSEYILHKGITKPLNLAAVAEHHRCKTLKQNTLKEYLNKGYSVRDIPRDELQTYLKHDLGATKEIYQKQRKKLINSILLPTIQLTNEVTYCLTKVYKNGFKIDKDKLKEVRKEFEDEKLELETSLQKYAKELMGDTPINLNSPEQLSWVLFSRKPHSKSAWAKLIDKYMNPKDFKILVKQHFQTLYKTKAEQCVICKGKGSVYKIKKDGSNYKKATKCAACKGLGYILKDTKYIAGLKFNPTSARWASANGFKTGKGNLDILQGLAEDKGMKEATEFLGKLKRLSAITSYLSNFVDGIENYMKEDSMLHVRLNQHVTATGRFSGSNPNMQNIPRGSTFPVKKVFVSRFEKGKILEADFAQLEFRVAAFLSQDKTAMHEIDTGFDVHSYTAKVITDAGQETSRQVAKGHTFAPLFGASGYGRSKAEATYYKHFIEKYKGIAKWHKKLGDEAVEGKVTTPSGRQYAFPDVVKRKSGQPTHFTMIKNYPVQGFSNDIVQVIYLELNERLEPLQSCVVNSVHDSIVVDVHPNETNYVIQIIKDMNNDLDLIIEEAYDVKMNVPLLLEAKIGSNWLDIKDVI